MQQAQQQQQQQPPLQPPLQGSVTRPTSTREREDAPAFTPQPHAGAAIVASPTAGPLNEAPTPPSAAALVMVAKWPGSGASKTRLASQLAASPTLSGAGDAGGTGVGAASGVPRAQRWAAAFVKASVSDLLVRFGAARDADGGSRGAVRFERVLLYAPPTDEARGWFAGLLDELGCADAWRLLPVLAASDAKSSDLGALLADATRRARAECGVQCVALCGADCPELPLSSVDASMRAALGGDGRVAAICPASDGGYTLLALPAAADPIAPCFDRVHWSASDTCLSQLAALSRAGLTCVVGETHADVDELDDLKALAGRLLLEERVEERGRGGRRARGRRLPSCPRTALLLREMRTAGLV